MSGTTFFDYILRYFDIKKIIVAGDFKFGYRAKNTVNDLKDICAARGTSIKIIKKKKINNQTVSSSFIRRLIKKGDFPKAALSAFLFPGR